MTKQKCSISEHFRDVGDTAYGALCVRPWAA